ncbi:histidine kinase dimerization/phospho-acceptor domain-containing protein [Dongshaea marina]|uniref:histidine kinase dimerization/phospho-acceptor domain-containing protein n=1 Tax=Dongshaea marina TaxID=2047966 RepID=UPI000D3E9356|nr:histidine kinase dimerization/phospho-acceptor domain-containing protein [Dongshaea marina]
MKSIKVQVLVIVILTLIICLVIGQISIQNDRAFIQSKIQEFQQQQLSSAIHLSERIHSKFDKLDDALLSLSQMPKVQFMQRNELLLNMIRIYRMNNDLVEGIFRVDSHNALEMGYPSSAPHPTQDELEGIFDKARMTGASSIEVIRRDGSASDLLVFAIPVYTVQGKVRMHPTNKFAGLLYFTVSLKKLNQHLFDFPHYGKSGFPWVMTGRGVIVGSEVPRFLGKEISELEKWHSSREHRGFTELIDKMRNGELGVVTYTHALDGVQRIGESPPSAKEKRPSLFSYLVSGAETRDQNTYYVAFAPIELYGEHWSVAVTHSQQDITLLIETAIGSRWVNMFALLLTIIGMVLILILLLQRNHRRQVIEIHQGQVALRDAEKKYRSLVETSNDAIVILRGRETVYFNPAYLELVNPEHTEQGVAELFSILSEEQSEKLMLYQQRRLTKQWVSDKLELALATRGEEPCFVTVEINGILYQGKQAAMLVMHDTTVQRRHEQALREAKDQAEAANGAKSEFLARMSHEIRTPINGVIGITELVLETSLTLKQHRFIQTIQRSGQDLLTLVNDILDFSKIEADKLKLEHIEFELYELVEDVVELLAVRAERKDLAVICDIDHDVPLTVQGIRTD